MDYSFIPNAFLNDDALQYRGEGSGSHGEAQCAEADGGRIREDSPKRSGDQDMMNVSSNLRKSEVVSLEDALAFTIDRTAQAESPTKARRENSLGKKTSIPATIVKKPLASVVKRGKKNIFAPQNLFPKAFPLRRKVSSPPKRTPVHLSSPSPTSHNSDAAVTNLEEHFAFYAAYDNSYTNVCIHMLFVIPVLFTALVFCTYTPAFVPTPTSFPGHQYVVFNFSFVIAAFYSFYFLSLDRRSGWLAALLVLLCWPAANAMVTHVDKEVAWKIALVLHGLSWGSHYLGRSLFEGRAPVLLENLAQAILMAPFFVIFELLGSVVGYDPGPALLNARVSNSKFQTDISAFHDRAK